MSEREIIGFNEDAEHVLCPRCSKDRICCEMVQLDCDNWEHSDLCCNGRRWFWYCDCDEQGRHDGPRP